MSEIEETESPCDGTCEIDRCYGVCRGCARTPEEIRDWPSMSDDERKDLLDVLSRRRAFDPRRE